MRRPVVLLDTNVWAYVADQDSGDALARLARLHGVDIAVAPGVAYEVLRVTDPDVMRKQTRLLVRPEWRRLMPEAYSESRDVLAEIRRLRPDWAADVPDNAFLTKLKRDWVSRSSDAFWGRLRDDPAAVALDQVIGGEGRHVADLIHENNQALRHAAIRAGWAWHDFDLMDVWFLEGDVHFWSAGSEDMAVVAGVPGAPAEPIAAWRQESHANWTRWLVSEQRSGPWDWIGPQLSSSWPPAPQEWAAFWLEVQADRVPREVTRWAVARLQALRKTTRSTQFDNQVASYLADADHVVTADRAFADVIEVALRHLPFLHFGVHRIPGGPTAVGSLLDLLARLRV